MTSKKEDQLLCDYFRGDESIVVNCKWLQDKLQTILSIKRDNDSLRHRLQLLEASIELKKLYMPDYYLDERV